MKEYIEKHMLKYGLRVRGQGCWGCSYVHSNKKCYERYFSPPFTIDLSISLL